MPTHRLYYDDSYLQSFTAQLLRCVPGAGPSTFEAILDRTAFYPTSGGQPNDLGTISNARALDVRDDGDTIVHILDRELSPGEVVCAIDWPRRFDHMQQHTGQHVLSAIFQDRYKLPTVSFHLGSDLCTIDLRGFEPSSEILAAAQIAANTLFFENRPVTVRYGTADELAAQGVRKEVGRQGTLRAIEIASADLQPCGGTHVKHTGEIGLILVRRCAKIRQDWRVEFACGHRAARLATADFQLLRSIGEKLSSASSEALAAIDKALVERDAHFKNLKNTLGQLAVFRARDLLATAPLTADGLRLVALLMEAEPVDLLLPLATELAGTERVIAVLVHAPSGSLVFAQHPSVGKDLPAALKQIFATIPGKGGGKRDFVRAQLNDASQSAAALVLAQKIIRG